MSATDEFRRRTRATWAAGDWDSFARLVAPVGALVLDRIALEPPSPMSSGLAEGPRLVRQRSRRSE